MRKATMVMALTALLGVGSAASGSRPAIAAAEDGMSAVRGVGMLTCGQFIGLIEEQSPAIEMIAGWIDGFVSGLDAASPQVVGYLPWQHTETVLELLAKHCSGHLGRTLVEALSIFIDFSRATWLTEQSEVVRVPLEDQRHLEIMKATLLQAQQVLAELGHYTATVDGAYGPSTAAAFRAFQADRGFEQTGLPDQNTLWNLFLPLYAGQPTQQSQQ